VTSPTRMAKSSPKFPKSFSLLSKTLLSFSSFEFMLPRVLDLNANLDCNRTNYFHKQQIFKKSPSSNSTRCLQSSARTKAALRLVWALLDIYHQARTLPPIAQFKNLSSTFDIYCSVINQSPLTTKLTVDNNWKDFIFLCLFMCMYCKLCTRLL